MKKPRAFVALAALIGVITSAHGQGLLSIGNTSEDFDETIDLTWTAALNIGWDDNPDAVSNDEKDSWYIQTGIGLRYADGSRVTRYSLGASFSVLYYGRGVGEDDDNWFYDARLSFSVFHRPSRRLSITNNFYVTYEIEPDASIGASRLRRTDQYWYLYNRFSVSYAWTRLFSTTSAYTFTLISYEDDDIEDRYSHRFTQDFRYLWRRTTALVAEYRFIYTTYDDADDRDYISNFLLVGADHDFSRVTHGSFRVGAEWRDFDNASNRTSPYVEGSLRHQLNEGWSLIWMLRYGYEDGELGNFNRRQSFRTALTAIYEFTPRLVGTASLSYVHSKFEDSDFRAISNENEDYFGASLGLSYVLYSNIRLNGGYSYSNLNSDRPTRDYGRNRLFLGVSATF